MMIYNSILKSLKILKLTINSIENLQFIFFRERMKNIFFNKFLEI